MARANSKVFRGTVVFNMIFMVFWVSLVTAAEGEKTLPGRNKTKGSDDTERLVPGGNNGYREKKMYTVKRGFVYVIQMSRTNVSVQAPPPLIKVGETGLNGLVGRRSELNTGNPYRLDYVAIWKVTDTKIGEEWAQATLTEAKPFYGGGREWFILPTGGLADARKLIQDALDHSNVLDPDKRQNM